jgi:hypothetical protein
VGRGEYVNGLRTRQPARQEHPRQIRTRALAPLSLRIEEANVVGNSKYQLKVPVVRLPGRGLDLALDLTYNSRLWHKAGQEIHFSIDNDWPAPGWSLGFGKLVFWRTPPGGEFNVPEYETMRVRYTN